MSETQTSSRGSRASSPSRPRSRSPTAKEARSATAASTSRSSSAAVPYENVWGLLVDERLESGMPEPEAVRAAAADGKRAGRRSRPRSRACRATGSSASFTEISDEQARDDLARLSAQMMAIVARSARVADGHEDPVPDEVVARGDDGGREVPAALARRGGSRPRQGDRHLLDLHGRARAERLDLHRADRRVDRSRLRRCDVGGDRDALGPAARRRARARHADDRRGRGDGRPRAWVKELSTAASGSWASATASTGPRTRGRASQRGPRRSSVAARRDGEGARGGGARGAPAAPSRARAGDERRVLGRDRPRRRRDPGEARRPRCSRALGSRAGRRTSSSRSDRPARSGRRPATSGRARAPCLRSHEARRRGDAGGRARAGR